MIMILHTIHTTKTVYAKVVASPDGPGSFTFEVQYSITTLYDNFILAKMTFILHLGEATHFTYTRFSN